ncbi:MAG: hypothetical protein ACI35W_00140 [Anaeroplasmataceae bacterium]
MKMRKMFDLKSKEGVLKTFFILSLLSTFIIFISYIICYKMGYQYRLFISIFADFGETIASLSLENPYDRYASNACIYPPNIFILLYPFYLICKGEMKGIVEGSIDLKYLFKEPMFLLSYLLFFIITLSISLFFLAKASKLKGKSLFYLLAGVVLSGPMYYTFIRGNTVILCFMFLTMFYYFYNKDSKLYKELALISLAFAISIKIYPMLLCGIFFYKNGLKKGILEILRCGMYTIILVMVPFLIFGFDSVPKLIDNALYFADESDRYGDLRNISVHSIVYIPFKLISMIFNTKVYYNAITIISLIITLILAIAVIFIPLIMKDKLKVYLLSMMLYALFPSISYAYVLLILFIPIIIYLEEFEKIKIKSKIVYGITFFIGVFQLFYFIKIIKVISIIFMIMTIYIIYDEIKNYRMTIEV